MLFEVNKSVYIAKSRQWHDKTQPFVVRAKSRLKRYFYFQNFPTPSPPILFHNFPPLGQLIF